MKWGFLLLGITGLVGASHCDFPNEPYNGWVSNVFQTLGVACLVIAVILHIEDVRPRSA